MPKCPKNCKKQNPLIFKKTVIPAIVGNDDIVPPENGAFCNMLVVYEATGNAYLYSSDGIPTLLSTTDYTRLKNLPTINGEIILGDLTLEDLGISQLVEAEAEDRREADTILQTQIDAIAASSDVVDIVGTYEELEEYDTSRLTDNDIIKVIADETVGGATTYYRWENHEWVYIGAEGPYYTKNETDALLDQKLDVDALDDVLEDYYDKDEVDALLDDKADVSDLAGKQDTLIAGDNITIDQATNVISAIVPSLSNYYTKQETYSQNEVDGLISGVQAQIPTATSQLNNDSGFLTTVPIATNQLLGGIKVGTGLSITQDGTLSADAQHIDVDTALSTTSTNPVENRVITNALNNKANLSDIPTVPTNVSAFYNDAGYITNTVLAQNYYNKTETYNRTEIGGLIAGVEAGIPTKTSDLTNDGASGQSTYVESSQLATVATSGSYDDLTDKPTIPAAQVNADWDASSGVAEILNKPTLAAVATSGSYNDLSNKPTIPTVNNATLTIQRNSATVDTFTANASVDKTVNISVPTKTSDITNDSGFITISSVPTKTSDLTNDGSGGTSTYVEADDLATVATSGSYNDLSNKPTIPAAQVNSDWNASSGVAQILNKPALAAVATSGSYTDLSNTPSIPTKTSDLVNDGSDNTAQYLETDETAYQTASIPYGACDNTSTATVFTATVPGITALRDGVCMWLKNGVVTSASGFTININNLGAKPVYQNMAAASRDTTLFNINYTMFFVYDSTRVSGGCWVLYRGYDSNTNTIGYQIRTNSSTLPAKEKGYRYRLWLTSADGQNYVPINTATGTSTTATKALNTDTPIDPFGAIVYNSTNGTVNADANLPNGTQWTQYALDMRYQKYPLTLTYPDPVYLQCTPQSTGGALINDIVQTLPSTEDGKIYIYLGNAYSATNMELKQNHPVYYYKDGAIRLWTNDTASINSVAWGDITGTLSDQTDLNTALGAKANSSDLATVATSGSYSDLTDKPTIPTVNNATLTIQRNSTNVATFTANAASNVTANISVPTATSDLTNDSGFITSITKITNAEIDAIMGVS